ncbi:MAG: hypothetical protein H0V97_08125 [Actinobacteria bacterium]|nr:hypothetical protein [Actinomycetota bacterium]
MNEETPDVEQQPAPVVGVSEEEALIAARVAAEVARVEAARVLRSAFRLMKVGYLILAAFVVLSFFRGYQVDKELGVTTALVCSELNKTRETLRTILEDAARRTAVSKQRTPEEKAEAAGFYAAALARIPPDACGPKPGAVVP